MKKIILSLLIVPVAFLSCKKSGSTSSAPPTSLSIKINPSSTNAIAGSQIPFVVKISSNNALTAIVVMQSIGSGAATQAFKNDITSKSLTTYLDTENYTVPTGVTGPVTLTWTVTDSKNNTATATATITVSPPVSVRVDPTTTHANGGDQLTFVVNMSSNNTLSTVLVTQSIAGGTAAQLNKYDISSKNATTFSYTESYVVPSNVQRPIVLTWTVTDSRANTNTTTATINQ